MAAREIATLAGGCFRCVEAVWAHLGTPLFHVGWSCRVRVFFRDLGAAVLMAAVLAKFAGPAQRQQSGRSA